MMVSLVALCTYFILPKFDATFGSNIVHSVRRRLSGGGACGAITGFEDAVGEGLAVFIYLILLMKLFIGLAIVTDEYFVPALVVMSAKLNLSEDVAGATFMAAGSSAPELFTSLADTFLTEGSNIGVGTIVGSAVFNILVIIACAGAFAPEELYIDWRPMSRDISFYCGSILFLFLFTYFDGSCGIVTPLESFGMFFFYFFYVLFMYYNETFMDMCTDPKAAQNEEEETKGDEQDQAAGLPQARADAPGSAVASVAQEQNIEEDKNKVGSGQDRSVVGPLTGLGLTKTKSVASNPDGDGDDDDDDDEKPWEEQNIMEKTLTVFSWPWLKMFEYTVPDVNSEDIRKEYERIIEEYERLEQEMQRGDSERSGELQKLNTERQETKREMDLKEQCYVTAFSFSIVWIGLIAAGMVKLAERCGCIVGIPGPIMGVTVLAAGTSIPDALGSIIAAQARQGDMAVANAIGSNVFDILIGLGLPYGIYGAVDSRAKYYGGYVVALDGILAQMVILLATVVATLGLFMAFKWRLRPGLGWSMLVLYALFCVYSVVTANNPTWYQEGSVCTPQPA